MLVLRRGAAIQERSYGEGYVALHIAAMRGHRDCVELLLRAGAPAHPRSRDRDTPKDLAKDNGHYDLAVYLGKHLGNCLLKFRYILTMFFLKRLSLI